MIYAYDPNLNGYNQISRLPNAYQTSAVATKNAVQSVPAVQTVQNTQPKGFNYSDAENAKFLNQFQFSMKSLSSAANKLRSLSTSGVWNDLNVTSSDESVATVTTDSSLRGAANYDVNVLNLAKAQENTTKAMKNDGNDLADAAKADGKDTVSFEVKLKGDNGVADRTITVTANALDKDGNSRSNIDIMSDLANGVNSQNQGKDNGVTAKIVSDSSGNSSFKLQSETTGKTGEFEVTGAQNSALSGLDTVAQKAENARYTVSKDGKPMNGGMVYQSDKNEGIKIGGYITDADGNDKLAGYGIKLDLKNTGSVELKVDVDPEKVVKLAEDFVKQYNDTVKFLVDNAHRGTGVSDSLNRLLQPPISADTMKSIGITVEDNGLYSLDKEKFTSIMKDDPRKIYDIMSDNYSIADGVYQDAQRASALPANNLLNTTPTGHASMNITIINNYYDFTGLSMMPFNPFPMFFNMTV